MDEQNHLARGIVFLRTGDPRFSLEHPPLINTISALGLLTENNLRLPIDHPSWNEREGWYAFAEQLLWVYNEDARRMVFLARMPIIYLTLSLGLVGYLFAKELWGRLGALVAIIFILFDPNIMAHGRYSTTDVGGALFALLSAFLFWRLWVIDKWAWDRLLIAACGLGLALGSKLSNLIFIPIFVLLAGLPLYGYSWNWRSSLKRILQLGVAGLISLFVVWVIFAFEWGPYRFLTEPYSQFNNISGPLPTFLAGIEQIFRVSGGGRPAFLLGQFSTEGWWYYFPVAYFVKTPVLVILLFLTVPIILLLQKNTRNKATYLVIPPFAYFLVSMFSALNIGYRHLLPILPFLYVLTSGVTTIQRVLGKTNQLKVFIVRGALISALISVLVIDLTIHPHYLSYFNVLAGGPSNGHRILVDSNIDWGQDLERLRSWMVENHVARIKLSYFGSADPTYYGINYDPLPGLTRHFDLWWDVPFNSLNPEPGVYAISASNLWEIPLKDKTVFPWFRMRKPDDKVGYSIFIYSVGNNE